jgi:hypothetical protein
LKTLTQKEIKEKVNYYTTVCRIILKDIEPDYYYAPFVLKVDFNPKRISHRGGMYAKGPGINMAMNVFTYSKECFKLGGDHPYYFFQEMPSYADDPIIGSAHIDCVEQHINLSVAHEVAHSVQCYVKQRDKVEYVEPHGKEFKKYYQILRLEVNKTLPDQQFAEIKYKELLSSIKKRELYAI